MPRADSQQSTRGPAHWHHSQRRRDDAVTRSGPALPPTVPPSAPRRSSWAQDLRHFDHLLGHREDQLLVENLHHGSGVGKLLHGVPQNPLLRPRLRERLGPRPAGLFSVQLVVLRLGRGRGGEEEGSPGNSAVQCVSTSPPSRSCPSSHLVKCGASSRARPSRRLAVHAARTDVKVALTAFERRQRVRHWLATTARSRPQKSY